MPSLDGAVVSTSNISDLSKTGPLAILQEESTCWLRQKPQILLLARRHQNNSLVEAALLCYGVAVACGTLFETEASEMNFEMQYCVELLTLQAPRGQPESERYCLQHWPPLLPPHEEPAGAAANRCEVLRYVLEVARLLVRAIATPRDSQPLTVADLYQRRLLAALEGQVETLYG
jgi:hypothetical protein